MYGAWDEMLKESRQTFGTGPRSFGFWERRSYLRIPNPAWMSQAPKNDKLVQLLALQKEIFQNGCLVWGHIVQANTLLFEPGKDNYPALVVYAPDPEMQMDPRLLEDVAQKSFQLKGTQPRDKDKLAVAQMMTDEMSRPTGFPIPRTICSIGNLLISITFCARHHFPKKQLCASVFPMVRHAIEPQWVLPLPEKYWAKRLVEWWCE